MICLLCLGTSLPHSGQLCQQFGAGPAPHRPALACARPSRVASRQFLSGLPGQPGLGTSLSLAQKTHRPWGPGSQAWCAGRKRILEHQLPCPARLRGVPGGVPQPAAPVVCSPRRACLPEQAEHGHTSDQRDRVQASATFCVVQGKTFSKSTAGPFLCWVTAKGARPHWRTWILDPALEAAAFQFPHVLDTLGLFGRPTGDAEWPAGKALCDPRLSP